MANFYENVDRQAILNRMVQDYQAVLPSWQPTDTDPWYMLMQALASRESVLGHFFNERFKANIRGEASGTDLDNLAATLAGLTRRVNEIDSDLDKRLGEKLEAEGAAGTPSAYRSQARAANANIIDAKASVDEAPNEGRTLVTLISTDAVQVARADNLRGVPNTATVTAVQDYLRDESRRLVGDEDLVAQAYTPTEYRIGITTTPTASTLSPIQRTMIRSIVYEFIDSHRRFDARLQPNDLLVDLKGLAFLTDVDITTFATGSGNPVTYTGIATLIGTGLTVYDCAQTDVGVTIT